LEPIRFNDLRHFSVTFLIGKNMSIKSLSSRARHSRIGTTMDTYGHNIIEVDQIAAAHFSEFCREKALKNKSCPNSAPKGKNVGNRVS
jgi:integrase